MQKRLRPAAAKEMLFAVVRKRKVKPPIKPASFPRTRRLYFRQAKKIRISRQYRCVFGRFVRMPTIRVYPRAGKGVVLPLLIVVVDSS